MGFATATFSKRLGEATLAVKPYSHRTLGQSGYSRSLLGIPGYGGAQPGQNRDNFPAAWLTWHFWPGFFFLAVGTSIACGGGDGAEPLPRSARRKNKSASDRGLPDDAELLNLAAAYLHRQRSLWPEMARSGALPEPTDEVLKGMVDDYKKRHRGGKISLGIVASPKSAKLAGCYERYSCDKSNPTSIVDQLCRCLIKAQADGYFIPWAYVYGDYSISGLDSSRQGYSSYKALLADNRQPLAVTYIDDFTRASRAEVEWWLLASLCKKLGKGLIGASDNFDLSSPHADIYITVFGLVSRLFLKGISQKVMRGMKGAVERGGCLGRLPLGFTRRAKLDRKGNPILRPDGRPRYERCIDPATRADALAIYTMFVVDKLSRSRITKIFNERKMEGWSGWTDATITKLLSNPLFIGVVIWNQRKTEFDPEQMTWTTVKNPMSSWEYSFEPDLCLIPQDLWFAAQERLAECRGRNKNAGRPWTRNEVSATTLFSGTLFCGYCGRELTLIRSTAKYKQMGCMHGLNRRHDCGLFSSKTTRVIEACLLEYLNDAILTEEAIDELVERANQHLAREAAKPKDNMYLKEKQAKKLRQQIAKLIRMVEDEEDTSLCKAYHDRARELQQQLGIIQDELRHAVQANGAAVAPLDRSRMRELLVDAKALLNQEIPVAAAAIRELTGRIAIHQEAIPGRKNGARWLATFHPDLVRMLAKVAKQKNYPESVILEFLCNRKWITADHAQVVIDHITQYERLGPTFLELNKRGVSVHTIGAAYEMSGTQAAQILHFAKTGERPRWKNRKKAAGHSKPRAETPLYIQISPEVAELRDNAKASWPEIRSLLAERHERTFADTTLRRAYDFAHVDAVREAAMQGKNPMRGRSGPTEPKAISSTGAIGPKPKATKKLAARKARKKAG